MTAILGISAYYHNSAACLVRDGEIVAAVQEERFTRKKHDPGFPHRAIDYCLEAGEIRLKDVSHLVFYDKPLMKFERLLETYLAFAPTGLQSFLAAMPVWMKEKLNAMLVNTSFNVRGEPIVCTPEDAYRCFMRTEMDVLVLENCVLYKTDQKPLEGDSDWKKEFELD